MVTSLNHLSTWWKLWISTAAASSLLACHDATPQAAAATSLASASQAVVTPAAMSTTVVLQQIADHDGREPWFGLTASDGSGLEITNVEVKSVLDGPLAFTELHLYFRNPEARVREGKFRITLPDGAAISRFAMENDGQFMEAEVVEKQLARRVYDDFLHRRQDPALLEQAAGNEFAAKVFPIPANGVKHLVVSFSQELANDSYRLPLRGLPKLGSLSARVQVLGADGNYRTTTLEKKSWTPDADLIAQGKTLDAVAVGDMVAMRIAVTGAKSEYRPSSVSVLFDTSASRSLGFASDLDRLERIVADMSKRLGAQTPLEIIAFDQTAQTVFSGAMATFDRSVIAKIKQRGALGASDIGSAMQQVSKGSNRQVIVISDAVATAGDDKAALAESAKKLGDRGVTRLDVALVGGIRDSVAATALSNAGLANAGAVLDVDRLGSDEVARRLGVAMNVNIPVVVDGAGWTWPRTIAAAQSGDSVIVYARGLKSQSMAAPHARMGASNVAFAATRTPAPLLERSMVRAQIAEIEAQLAAATTPEQTASLKKQLISMSVKNRVMSSVTSMLVLESDQDYERYQIPRAALADVLSVGAGGVQWLQRKAPAMQIAATKVAKPEQPQLDYRSKNKKSENQNADGDVDGVADLAKDSISDGKAYKADIAGEADSSDTATDSTVERKEPAAAEQRRMPPAPAPAGGRASGIASSSAPVTLRPPIPDPQPRTITRPPTDREPMALEQQDDSEPAQLSGPAPLTGQLATIMAKLKDQRVAEATKLAEAWHDKEPGDVLALVAVGETSEARKDSSRAARAYGSIIDLFPERADLRRFAGQRLARLVTSAQSDVMPLLIDTYRKAVADRPDHPSSHRMLAYALARAGKFADAFAAIEAGVKQQYRSDSYRGVDRVFHDDVGIVASAWIASEPKLAAAITKRAEALGAKVANQPSTRFILYWETDANDVDFHIQDRHGGHAFYSQRQLRSGGELYADITTGYGPECFAIDGRPKAGPYRLSIHYYSKGPMGYGMGSVEILRHDGKGHLSFETRPYTVMVDQAFVDLGMAN
jgi:hypothetical protein